MDRPSRTHAPTRAALVDEAGGLAWTTVGKYLRGVAIVGVVDALLIAIAMLALGVPLVLPLAVITFGAAFFPIVGALSAGILASLVALLSEGFIDALILGLVIFAVQQIEGDVLYPLVVGREIELHPVPTLLALTAGGVLLGIVGAFLAVPLVAIGYRVVRLVRSRAATAEILDESTAVLPTT